jgi:sugar phosphate isomerase/epimerase
VENPSSVGRGIALPRRSGFAPAMVSHPPMSRLGICTFSCHQHWQAVEAKIGGVKFTDALSFYRYARELGADGVQTPLRVQDASVAQRMRELIERTGGYYEAELRLPLAEADVAGFEIDVRLAREAGATVARSYFTVNRRYEFFKTLAGFHAFHEQATRSLRWSEPILRKHRLKLAVENHKDFTTDELIALIRGLSSEWIGVLVDTGNNLALLEEPYETVEALAPWALSVHLKDMAVQPCDNGFLLSEVPLGSGMFDLTRMVNALLNARPDVALNLEMATRDPLRIPCLTDEYYTTFAGNYREKQGAAAINRARTSSPGLSVPRISGKTIEAVLAEEETYNRESLAWMRQRLGR